jgi:hypothetical protein
MRAAGVVDEHVDPAMSGDDLRDHVRGVCGIGDVELDGGHLAGSAAT